MEFFSLKQATIIANKIKKNYNFNPFKRTWIPKPAKKKKKPLDIPTQFDRII